MAQRFYYDVRQYAILADVDRRILALQLPLHYKPYGGQWTLPGGKLEPKDEEPELGILREIEEETGLLARVERPFYVGKWTSERSCKIAIFYLCAIDEEAPALLLSNEHRSAQWLTIQDALHTEFYAPYFQQALQRLASS